MNISKYSEKKSKRLVNGLARIAKLKKVANEFSYTYLNYFKVSRDLID
jgi:hypothetical protein